MLGQLLRVVGARVTPQDQPLVAEYELEVAHVPGQPGLDMLFDAGQPFVRGAVSLKLLVPRPGSNEVTLVAKPGATNRDRKSHWHKGLMDCIARAHTHTDFVKCHPPAAYFEPSRFVLIVQFANRGPSCFSVQILL